MSCSCEKVRAAKRCPRGAHTDNGGVRWCAECWHARYILRAVTLPVAGPVDGAWAELREGLKTVFRATVRLSNWAVTELAKGDVVRTPEMNKLPKPPEPRPYLYPGARKLVPELDSGSVVAILHAVEARWRKRRYHVVWLGSESLPNYRYDRAVYPVRSQDWRAMRGDDGEALVSVRLAGRRWCLRLRGGPEFRRQLIGHRALADGRAVGAELALYEQRTGTNDHRPGLSGRDAGGQRSASRLMCKLVAWLPREAPASVEGVLFVSTSEDALVVALDAKQSRLWTIHADQVRRWSQERRRRIASLADDRKMETRRGREALLSRSALESQKYARRMKSAVQQYAAQVVGYAQRRRFAALCFTSGGPRTFSEFPWAALRDRIAAKCDEAGIEFKEIAGGESNGNPAQ